MAGRFPTAKMQRVWHCCDAERDAGRMIRRKNGLSPTIVREYWAGAQQPGASGVFTSVVVFDAGFYRLSFRGAALAASPESKAPIGGYGCRARELKLASRNDRSRNDRTNPSEIQQESK
jgi:hypothetical protein